MAQERTPEYFLTIMKRSKDKADPNVINEELIREYIRRYNIENKIFGMDDMPLTQLVELRLSFRHILAIQNLDGLVNLRKLCLDNNIIDRIDGLETLENLEWLDLSFNQIKEIEGLEGLINLTDLSLFHNEIVRVDNGLDQCTRLNVFSIGDNKISSYEPTIPYLRRFKQLQVLNMSGNPICNDHHYKLYVIAILNQLIYLDYVYIREDDRTKAEEQHHDEVDEFRARETSQEQLEKEMQEQKEKDALDQAFLLVTHGIIEHLLEDNDEEEAKIRVLPDQTEYFSDFQDNLVTTTTEFQKIVLQLNDKRLNMINRFKDGVNKAISTAEQEDIRLIGDYEKEETKATRVIEDDYDLGIEKLNELHPQIDILEDKLIDKELELVERVNGAVDDFEKKLKAITDEIKEEESAQKMVDDYFEIIEKTKDERLKAFSAENVNHENFTQEEKEVYKEKDQLSGAISNQHEDWKTKIYGIEESIQKDFEADMVSFLDGFKESQHRRNRKHVDEIIELSYNKRAYIERTIEEND